MPHMFKTVFAIAVCFIQLILISSTLAGRVPSDNELLVSVELVSEESNPYSRERRSVDSNLPDWLHFRFPMQNVDVKLRMKRSRLLPTKTSEGSQVKPYFDEGSFIHGDKEWSIEPLSRQKRDVGKETHRVFTPVAKGYDYVISLRGDQVFVGKDPRSRSRRDTSPVQEKKEKTLRLPTKSVDGNVTTGDKPRIKRNAGVVPHVIEIVFVIDYSETKKWLYSYWYFSEKGVMHMMILQYTYVAEAMNLRFQSIEDPEVNIRTNVIELKIINGRENDVTFKGSYRKDHYDKLLKAFGKWFQKVSHCNPSADHYMLFTGSRSSADLTTLGIGYMGQLCTNFSASMIVTENNGLVATVAAHELAHSLNASHDSETDSCTDDTQNVMATSFRMSYDAPFSSSLWKFSKCTVKAFKAFLKEKTKLYPTYWCTSPQNTNNNFQPKQDMVVDNAIMIDRHTQQCIIALGLYAKHCSAEQEKNRGYATICRGLLCSVDGGPCQAIIPRDYTICNSRPNARIRPMWCVKGRCVWIEDEIPDKENRTSVCPNTDRITVL